MQPTTYLEFVLGMVIGTTAIGILWVLLGDWFDRLTERKRNRSRIEQEPIVRPMSHRPINDALDRRDER